ncbi:NUDIX hydrolase [Nocardioides sp. KR10-350]|uniref:NUDIX hydrolase n=1 Tax=Nocardioides cheoyonin TaxID=3156615 RepID=UPI0032B4B31C
MRIPTPPALLPEKVVAVAQEYAAGVRTPVEPRDAATVILLRPGAGAPEVYLLRRQTSMAFAAGMCVFPGGGVDPRDAELGDEHWAGPSPAVWAERLGATEEEARALLAAAVRETFEESGVLLAGAAAGEVVADVSGEDWEADRVALESRELSLTELLDRRGLVLRTDLLGAWAAWTTPAFEPKRYRTWFFVASLPDGQLTRDVSSESESVAWLPTDQALAQADRGEIGLMHPTYLNILEISQYADPGAVLRSTADRRVEMFTPAVEEVDGGHALTIMDHHRELLRARHG